MYKPSTDLQNILINFLNIKMQMKEITKNIETNIQNIEEFIIQNCDHEFIYDTSKQFDDKHSKKCIKCKLLI